MPRYSKKFRFELNSSYHWNFVSFALLDHFNLASAIRNDLLLVVVELRGRWNWLAPLFKYSIWNCDLNSKLEFLRSVDKIILTRYNGDRRNNMYNGTRARGYIQLFYFVTGRSFIRYKACSRRRAEIHGRLRLYGNACKSRSSLDRDTRYILNTCKHALLPGRV